MRFNIVFTDGSADQNVDAFYFEGFAPSEIHSVEIIDANRPATRNEVNALCAGKWVGV